MLVLTNMLYIRYPTLRITGCFPSIAATAKLDSYLINVEIELDNICFLSQLKNQFPLNPKVLLMHNGTII